LRKTYDLLLSILAAGMQIANRGQVILFSLLQIGDTNRGQVILFSLLQIGDRLFYSLSSENANRGQIGDRLFYSLSSENESSPPNRGQVILFSLL
jgi:hypothetical protein